ncbi:MAG: hypothetical protein ABIJ96_03780 [Elusimicrobiota bacterium]
MPSRTESVTEFFRCVVPADWRAEARQQPDRKITYTDEKVRISVVRYGLKGSRYRDPRSFLRHMGAGGNKVEKLEEIEVSGQKAVLWRMRYEMDLSGAEYNVGEREWVHEEFVILQQSDSFYVLRFTSPSLMRRKVPAGAAVWQEFLKGFRLG